VIKAIFEHFTNHRYHASIQNLASVFPGEVRCQIVLKGCLGLS
jgi:hypothetical protein